jgi:hypothetical protein
MHSARFLSISLSCEDKDGMVEIMSSKKKKANGTMEMISVFCRKGKAKGNRWGLALYNIQRALQETRRKAWDDFGAHAGFH